MKEQKNYEKAECPIDTIPMNFQTEFSPWDCITLGILQDNCAENQTWKRNNGKINIRKFKNGNVKHRNAKTEKPQTGTSK